MHYNGTEIDTNIQYQYLHAHDKMMDVTQHRIRISNSALMIEKGRHRKINLANRICPLCRSEVEDEFHFSMICDKLKDICDKFFKKLTDIVPLFSNFSDLDKFFFIF
jgi:hypothetical protein